MNLSPAVLAAPRRPLSSCDGETRSESVVPARFSGTSPPPLRFVESSTSNPKATVGLGPSSTFPSLGERKGRAKPDTGGPRSRRQGGNLDRTRPWLGASLGSQHHLLADHPDGERRSLGGRCPVLSPVRRAPRARPASARRRLRDPRPHHPAPRRLPEDVRAGGRGLSRSKPLHGLRGEGDAAPWSSITRASAAPRSAAARSTSRRSTRSRPRPWRTTRRSCGSARRSRS